jgi:hypothetical protein
VVNSSQGGGSKDTWVLAGERRQATVASVPRAPERSEHHRMPALDAAVDIEIQQQQQQQQQQAGPEPC